MSEDNSTFIPQGEPLTAEELADYTEDGEEVAITRGDVERAITTADDELKKYLQATQYKPKQ